MNKSLFNWRRFTFKTAALAMLALPGIAGAQTFTFSQGDLILGFRIPSTGTNDLVVNIGSVSNFLALTPGTVLPIGNYNNTQLTDAFGGGLDNLQWSVSCGLHSGTPGFHFDGFVNNTVWYTLPRSSPGAQTTTPSRFSGQQILSANIFAIPHGAVDVSANGGLPTGTDNNTVLVREPVPALLNDNYYDFVPSTASSSDNSSTFLGQLSQNVENAVGSPFSSAVVSDLYQSVPTANTDPITQTSSGNAYYVGFFTLNTDGTMTFTRATHNQPTITSITRAGTTFTVSFTTDIFTTSNTPVYTLYYSPVITNKMSTWTALPGPVNGNGAVQSIPDTATDPRRFYRVKVQ